MEVDSVVSTELFVGSEQDPLQVQRVTVANRAGRPAGADALVDIRVEGAGVTTPEPVTVPLPRAGETSVVDVPTAVDRGLAEGSRRPVSVTVSARPDGHRLAELTAELTVAVPGWTMLMVPHFHYDPFWWNTQSGFLSSWDEQPAAAQEMRKPGQAVAFDLVRAHLELARTDPDYKFVLAGLDYLKPYWDVHPEDRAELRRLIAAGRVELVGGMYNEPNTNLTSLESTIRNTLYGFGFQSRVAGTEPKTGWMLDVFGHDPAFPAVLADAGMTGLSFARGPFHQWGSNATAGGPDGMQFATEVEWLAPDGRGLLAGYLAHHYPAGWRLNEVDTLAEAEEYAYTQFCQLKRVASTRNVLLPVGYNHVVPARWTTAIHREWNKRYVWPRFVCGLPGEFFTRVRAEARQRNILFSPQSRDMNPVYPGKDVSYIDVKQAQRAAENALLEAEKLATLGALLGAPFPAEAIDQAWRQLFFGAHHDGITGVTSDQVYLDLLGGWREAWDLATQTRDDALGHLAARVDTTGVGQPVLVTNAQSWPRTDVATVTVAFAGDGPEGVEVLDDAGRVVPTVTTGSSRRADGTLAAVTLTFVAVDVPATGYRVYRMVPASGTDAGWRQVDGCRAENDVLLVEADPQRGGALSRVLDKRTGRDLLRAGTVAGDVVLDDEYVDHPAFGKGPWHIIPTGFRRSTSMLPGIVRAEVCPVGQRLVTSCRIGELRLTTEITLLAGLDRVDLRTRVDGSIGQDRLLRVRFPLDIPGARPVYEVGNAVVGRTFGHTRQNVAEHPYVLDCPAYTWAGLSHTVRVALRRAGEPPAYQAIGVAEVVAVHGGTDPVDHGVRDLVAALVQQGVTATTSRPEGSRYGSLGLDSNLPDVRISIGGPDVNAFTDRVLTAAGTRYVERLRELVEADGSARLWVPAIRDRARTWVPGADLRGERDLPVLIVAGRDSQATADAVADLVADLADATIDAGRAAGPHPIAADERLADYSAAVLNRGTPGVVVEPDGTLYLSLMRACTGWPAGTWIDPPRRTSPDGTSFAVQHWSHTFEYALVADAGDWRRAGFVRAGHAYNSPLMTTPAGTHRGDLPPSASLLRAEPANVMVTALKPRGNSLVTGRPVRPDGGVVLRCFETDGQPVQARITSLLPLREGAVADILERTRTPIDDCGDALLFDLGAAATATVTARPDVNRLRAGQPAVGEVTAAAGADTLAFARYWLHNRGAAPAGHRPATVFVEPRRLDLARPGTLRVTVSATDRAAGVVQLLLPPGVVARGPQDLRFDLDDDYRVFDVPLVAESPAEPGVRHVTARLSGEHGSAVEDVATILLGGASAGTDLDVAWDTADVFVTPGGVAELRVSVANRCLDEVRGEAQIITPFGVWEFTRPSTRSFALAAGEQRVLGFPVSVPAGTDPATVWALVKVTAFGAIHYTPAVAVTIGAAGTDTRTAVGVAAATTGVDVRESARTLR